MYSRLKKLNIHVLAIVLPSIAVANPTAGQQQTNKQPPFKNTQAAKKQTELTPEARLHVRQAVAAVGLVSVRTSADSGQAPRPRGSAVVVRKDGVVVTNYHVIFDSRAGSVFGDLLFSLSSDSGANPVPVYYRLRPLLINKEYDLVLLRVEPENSAGSKPEPLPAVVIGDSKSIQLLDDLFIIGFPEKGGVTVTVNRGSVEGKDILGAWIKTDGRMIHGNSGGAAVNVRGELIGIPTKVVADSQPIDRDGDGFPEDVRVYGAVGFMRPAHLVSTMLAELDSQASRQLPATPAPRMMPASTALSLKGIVKSSVDGRPIAGALVGLLPAGTTQVTENSLLTWGSANAEGRFVLNKPVPPGTYTLRAKALGYDVSVREVKIDEKTSLLVVDLRPTEVK